MNATASNAEYERALTEARANEIYSSQLMRRFRDTLANVRDGLEDEGDRIYFGSTNDADLLREVIDAVEDLEWDRVLASSQKKPDLYARIRELDDEVRALRKEQKGMMDALESIDAVGVDFGHFESAARTMQEIARKAIAEVRS